MASPHNHGYWPDGRGEGTVALDRRVEDGRPAGGWPKDCGAAGIAAVQA